MRIPKEDLILKNVENISEAIGWLGKMTGEEINYGINTRYLKKIFNQYKLPHDKKILQEYVCAIYIIYMNTGILNCRYFKSVESALRFRIMYHENHIKMDKQNQKEKKKVKQGILNINTRLRTISKLEDRFL